MIDMQKIDKIAGLYIEKLILPSDPLHPLWNRENNIFSKPPKWNYIDGCIIKAIGSMYEIQGDQRLLDYAVKFTDAYVNEGGMIPTLNPMDYNLDNVNGGKNLIMLYKFTHDEKYRKSFEWIYKVQILKQPRLKCGNFFHKAIYPNQIWLDGVYMALPFMAEYAEISKDKSIYNDILLQLENIRGLMRDKQTGLYFHGYDETHTMYWAEPSTGLSHEFWLRSMGWFCAGLVDLYEHTENYPKLHNTCKIFLSELLYAISGYTTQQDMLCQLPAKPDLPGNYPESSGTLLFSYAALKAYRLGICGENIKAFGIKTLSAVTENFIWLNDSEIPVMKNICLMAGLGGDNNRNGSAEYYLSEPVVENDAKGIAPYLMAYNELKRIAANSGK